MGGGDHDAQIRPHGMREHGNGGGRHRPQQQNIHADRRKSSHQSRLDHIARQTRILADDHTMAMRSPFENQTGGLSHLQRQFWRDDFIGLPPDAIGTEIRFLHEQPDLT